MFLNDLKAVVLNGRTSFIEFIEEGIGAGCKAGPFPFIQSLVDLFNTERAVKIAHAHIRREILFEELVSAAESIPDQSSQR